MMSIFVSVSFGLLCACLFAGWTVIEGAGARSLEKRARRLTAAKRETRSAVTTAPRLRREALTVFDVLATRLVPRSAALKARLSASGLSWSIGRYALVCMVIGCFATALLMFRGMPGLGAIFIGLAMGLGFPHLLVGFMLKRRRAQFTKLFPEAIGLMVRGLKAGLPVTDTMLVIGREVSDPVGEEFRSVADQIKMGQRVEDALWAVARRLEMPEFNFLVITLSVQRETGGNLAETLQNLDEILRRRQQMKLKVKAMSSEAVASAGIIGSLPFIMIAMLFVVSRDYIMTLFTTGTGLTLAGIGAFSLGLGIFIMMRMVRFEI